MSVFDHKYKVNPVIKVVCFYPVIIFVSRVEVKCIGVFEELDITKTGIFKGENDEGRMCKNGESISKGIL